MARNRTRAQDVPRNKDGKFKYGSAKWWAVRMRVPYSKMYDAFTTLGIDKLETDTDLIRVVQYLQSRAIPFSVLGELLGPDTNLTALAAGEVKP